MTELTTTELRTLLEVSPATIRWWRQGKYYKKDKDGKFSPIYYTEDHSGLKPLHEGEKNYTYLTYDPQDVLLWLQKWKKKTIRSRELMVKITRHLSQ